MSKLILKDVFSFDKSYYHSNSVKWFYSIFKFSFFYHKISMDPNQFQTHIISLHGYSVSHPVTRLVVSLPSAIRPTSVTQRYCVQYAHNIGESFNHAHNICYNLGCSKISGLENSTQIIQYPVLKNKYFTRLVKSG